MTKKQESGNIGYKDQTEYSYKRKRIENWNRVSAIERSSGAGKDYHDLLQKIYSGKIQ